MKNNNKKLCIYKVRDVSPLFVITGPLAAITLGNKQTITTNNNRCNNVLNRVFILTWEVERTSTKLTLNDEF